MDPFVGEILAPYSDYLFLGHKNSDYIEYLSELEAISLVVWKSFLMKKLRAKNLVLLTYYQCRMQEWYRYRMCCICGNFCFIKNYGISNVYLETN
jgi:hypothetical protein